MLFITQVSNKPQAFPKLLLSLAMKQSSGVHLINREHVKYKNKPNRDLKKEEEKRKKIRAQY